MRTIYKYELKLEDEQTVEMPGFARILTVQVQDLKICLWAEVDTSFPTEARTIEIYGTGDEVLGLGRTYIGTVQRGAYVWHVYEKIQGVMYKPL